MRPPSCPGRVRGLPVPASGRLAGGWAMGLQSVVGSLRAGGAELRAKAAKPSPSATAGATTAVVILCSLRWCVGMVAAG